MKQSIYAFIHNVKQLFIKNTSDANYYDYFPSSLWENKDFRVSNLLFNLEFTKENSTNNYLGYTFEIVMKMHLILQ